LANTDSLYSRPKILGKFAKVLNDTARNYRNIETDEYSIVNEKSQRFFIYDLTDPLNKDTFDSTCINFINDHIYYFADLFPNYSYSHIAFLQNGEFKIFEAINCKDSATNLRNVIAYISPKLKNSKDKEEIITRLKNYRRYGSYLISDYPKLFCENEKIVENPDKAYNREEIINQFASILFDSAPGYKKYFLPRFIVEDERAIGFFIYDLTDPSNKQTSLTERVNFYNNHIYHFAFIDEPFSFSHIAILEDGKLKIFNLINCKNKGESLKDVLSHLKLKLKNDKNKNEILKRVKNYRKYGVYTSFNGSSSVRCEEAETIERQ
jgi:mannitol/fructose-specific phosphotransferase system IIA component (Ntr-type)